MTELVPISQDVTLTVEHRIRGLIVDRIMAGQRLPRAVEVTDRAFRDMALRLDAHVKMKTGYAPPFLYMEIRQGSTPMTVWSGLAADPNDPHGEYAIRLIEDSSR